MHEKSTICPNFTQYLPKKYFPKFYGANAPCTLVSYAYGFSLTKSGVPLEIGQLKKQKYYNSIGGGNTVKLLIQAGSQIEAGSPLQAGGIGHLF